MFVDTHAHLYHKQFDSDRQEMLQRALDAGVRRIYLPNIDAESIDAMHALEDAYPDLCRSMMGLHPCSVGEDPSAELDRVRILLASGRYWAVGEIGIDLHWDRTWLEQQQEAFRQQLRWAKELALPVVIHCRESFDEVLAIVEDEHDANLTGVFHCFTGTEGQGRRILDLDGFHLGIGGVITFSKSGLAETMARLGPDRCVLETDAPYLAPTPHRGKRNESAYIPLVAEALALATGRPIDEVAHITTRNAEKLFEE
ncbi:MAG: TatD family hydrolase [Flavobacteriales bacterium]|nr:TatD family hydrolase [Flavobacteriales bacterium]MCB9193432.1 TatD family hydrolase [Flavobacteriales bacterium]